MKKTAQQKYGELLSNFLCNDKAIDYKLYRDYPDIYIFFLAGPWKKWSLHLTMRCMKLMLLLKTSMILEEN